MVSFDRLVWLFAPENGKKNSYHIIIVRAWYMCAVLTYNKIRIDDDSPSTLIIFGEVQRR